MTFNYKNVFNIQRWSLFCFSTLFLLSFHLSAQNLLSGTVTDNDGTPIPGAAVLIKGTSNGTSTDFDGNYSINVDNDQVLIFQSIGFADQEITVANQTSINVVLLEDTELLDEIIVTGYGTVTKRDATGAVDAISSDEFSLISSDSPAQLLRGKVAGVQITSSTGEPGAGVSIRIRGNSSVRSGNEPLIVVDGVPLAGGNTAPGLGDQILGSGSSKNPLNFINQNDIESISILKDASSTAIYGSRGANGVIVITTKRAKGIGSDPKVTYSGSMSFSSFAQNSSFNDVMSRSEFINNLPSSATQVKAEDGEYNWQDTILRDATSTNHDFTISQSGEKSSTRVSIGASLKDGIVKKTGMDKYNISLFNSYDLFENFLNLQSRVLYSNIDDQSHLLTNTAGYVGNLIGTALYWRPTLNTRTGSEYTKISDDYLNPEHLLNAYDDNTITRRILASITATFKLTDYLTFKTIYAVDNSNGSREAQLTPDIDIRDTARVSDYRGQASIYNDDRLNKTFENTLNYIYLNNGLSLDLLVGYSYYSYLREGNQFHAKGFNENQTNLIDNLKGVVDEGGALSTESYKDEVELQSVFARAAITYDKYLATLTFRRDGSSKFGEGNKYGNFPSIGLGYKVIEDKTGVLNNLKARGSWGITGNQEFKVNSAISKSQYENTRIKVVTNANPDLKWERTTSYGLGLDFSFFERKISGSLDYFNRLTENLIFPVPEAATKPGPASPRFINLPGELENNGVEATLNYNLINKSDFSWDISVNASFLSNKIQNFAGFVQTGRIHGQGLSGAYAQVLTNDKPLYSYYIFEFKGYDDNGASQYTQPDGSSGPLGSAAKILDKQALPKTNLGFSTSVRYKDFDLSTSFYGQYGHYIYNNTANAYFFRGAYETRNVPLSVIKAGQAVADPNSPSTKFLEKGDFLRWANLTIGYQFGNSLLDSIGVSSARLFFNADNLATFTDYSGLDPEVTVDKSMNDVPSAGMDYLAYPRARTFTIGLNLSF